MDKQVVAAGQPVLTSVQFAWWQFRQTATEFFFVGSARIPQNPDVKPRQVALQTKPRAGVAPVGAPPVGNEQAGVLLISQQARASTGEVTPTDRRQGVLDGHFRFDVQLA